MQQIDTYKNMAKQAIFPSPDNVFVHQGVKVSLPWFSKCLALFYFAGKPMIFLIVFQRTPNKTRAKKR